MSTAIGRQAEELAARFLASQGYVILGRNLRLGSGELDIVARDGEILVFVEVKLRPTLDDALESLTPAKSRRIVSAAQMFRVFNPPLAGLQCRFDLIALIGSKHKIEHLIDIIRL